MREVSGIFLNARALQDVGLGFDNVRQSISTTYDLLDAIDRTLTQAGVFPLSQTVELANLSSMIGNILSASIAQHSNGLFRRNGPHKYPDLLSNKVESIPHIELKMALETNKPKGHLAKEGHYITCRYVLCDADGKAMFEKSNRGITAYIWELRCGYLGFDDFSISNTAGDSGKTAVVNAEGMKKLIVVYVDLERAPISRKGSLFRSYADLVEAGR
jgi:hypothetical protein